VPHFTPPTEYQPEPAPNRVRWTRNQCAALLDAGILEGRYELVEGEIISKMGQRPAHRIAVTLVCNWLRLVFGNLFVQSQASIDVADEDNDFNEPEPDAAVTFEPTTSYMEGNPGPADLVLVVEVSDTTLRFDRTTKVLRYAKAGIPEYWILDIAGRRLLVHRQPTANGYSEVATYESDELVTAMSRQDQPVRVSDLLPPLTLPA
jgi:Uncharacterized protein conserved in cyanobacteria